MVTIGFRPQRIYISGQASRLHKQYWVRKKERHDFESTRVSNKDTLDLRIKNR